MSLTTSITTRRSAPPAEDDTTDDIKCVCEVREKTRLLVTAAFVSIVLFAMQMGKQNLLGYRSFSYLFSLPSFFVSRSAVALDMSS